IGARSAANAMAAGKMPPDRMPERLRRPSSSGKLWAKALAIDAAVSSTRQIAIIRVLPMTSASGPRRGCRIAYGKANAVERRAAVAVSTESPAAICGMTGSTARVNREVAKVTTPTMLSRGFIEERWWMRGEIGLDGKPEVLADNGVGQEARRVL